MSEWKHVINQAEVVGIHHDHDHDHDHDDDDDDDDDDDVDDDNYDDVQANLLNSFVFSQNT